MNRWLYTASAKLGLWDSLFRSEDHDSLDTLLQSAANGVIEASQTVPTTDPNMASVIAVCDKIIARGSPTLVDLDFERALLSSPLLSFLGAEDIADGPVVGMRSDSFPFDTDELARAVEELLSLPYRFNDLIFVAMPRLTSDLRRLTSPEEDSFLHQFNDHFGLSVKGRIHRQVRIGDLAEIDIDRELSENRVDFAFRLANLRWVFEVDGSQHMEHGQKELDRRRDELLARNGWPVHRVTAQDVRNGQHLWPEQFANELHALAACDFDSIEEAISDSQRHAAAFHCILLPLAVHRCLRGLLHLYLFEILDPACEQRILVMEEDIPVTAEAFRMLNALWSRLHILAPSLPPAPRVHLEVIGEPFLPNLPSDPNVAVKQVAVPTGDYDAVISHSFLLAEGYAGALNETHFPNHPANLVRLRCAIGLCEERALQRSGSITYDLGGDSSQKLPAEKHDALRFFLQLIFRKRDFREGQLSAIARLLQGKPTIVLLPTGGGKSLIYQLTGLLLPGMTIVIDPIVALMNDQVANLRAAAIDLVDFIAGSRKPERKDAVLKAMGVGRLAFVFISPERLQSSAFRRDLRRVVSRVSVSLVAIDEAHCISEWGHDFRPSYLHLPYNLQKHCTGKNGESPTLVGLTGTASYAVLADVQREMRINDEEALVRPRSFDRPELRFEVRRVPKKAKLDELVRLKEGLPHLFAGDPSSFYDPQGDCTNSGIIFCPHVNGPLGVVSVASELRHANYFSGSTPRDFTGNFEEHKQRVQQDFKRNEAQEIVATKSFGMGIDKPNIRYTIHYTAPQSVEAFYQEAGRAGRNGEAGYARCVILYSDDSWDAAGEILNEPDHQQASKRLKAIKRENEGDLLVQSWFLYNSFKGRELEKRRAKKFIGNDLKSAIAILPEGESRTYFQHYSSDHRRQEYEQVIYRLMLLGVVQDYTIDWQSKQLAVTVKRISPVEVSESLQNYLLSQHEFPARVTNMVSAIPTNRLSNALWSAIDILIDYIYDGIVVKRKHALRTICELCRNFTSHENFRDSILNYLQESEFSEEIRGWLGKRFDEIGLIKIRSLWEKVDDAGAARRLIGSTRRMLDEEPGNAALRYLYLFSVARTPSESDSSVIDAARALQVERLLQAVRDPNGVFIAMLEDVRDGRPALLEDIADDALRRVGDASIARLLLQSSLANVPLIRSHSAKLLAAEALRTVKACAYHDTIARKEKNGRQ